ncbi:MAG: hypothetical protein KF686_08165 [Ramlibacter sp.]|nr:hypothetical protein [Ramlibacter sp.]
MTAAAANTTAAQALHRLQVVLFALLPKGGEPMTVACLAKASGATAHQVTEALFPYYLGGSLSFDVLSDSFSAPKQGCALPATPAPTTPPPTEATS